jgi:hypothetical protein
MSGPYFVAFVAMPLTVLAIAVAGLYWHKYTIVPRGDRD